MMACAIVEDPAVAGNPFGPPVADFSVSNNDVFQYASVYFTDDTTQFPTSWKWFIDGVQFSSIQNPSYFFTTPGNHAIVLIAYNSYGNNSKERTVYVNPHSA
jgi:PKD repeat protein